MCKLPHSLQSCGILYKLSAWFCTFDSEHRHPFAKGESCGAAIQVNCTETVSDNDDGDDDDNNDDTFLVQYPAEAQWTLQYTVTHTHSHNKIYIY